MCDVHLTNAIGVLAFTGSKSAVGDDRVGTEPQVGFIDKAMCHFLFAVTITNDEPAMSVGIHSAESSGFTQVGLDALFFNIGNTEGLFRIAKCEPTLFITGGRDKTLLLFQHIS
jgi:hypothetical protein